MSIIKKGINLPGGDKYAPSYAMIVFILLAVIATISFFHWFTSFQSNVLQSFEADTGQRISIIGVILNDLYILSKENEPEYIFKIEFDNFPCYVSEEIRPHRVTDIPLSRCSIIEGEYFGEIKVFTDKATYTKEFYKPGQFDRSKAYVKIQQE
jgi:hypothetical protein